MFAGNLMAQRALLGSNAISTAALLFYGAISTTLGKRIRLSLFMRPFAGVEYSATLVNFCTAPFSVVYLPVITAQVSQLWSSMMLLLLRLPYSVLAWPEACGWSRWALIAIAYKLVLSVRSV